MQPPAHIPAKRPATYQDVLDAPADKVAEIIGDELVLSPRPGGRHGRIAHRLAVQLGGPFELHPAGLAAGSYSSNPSFTSAP